MRNPVGIGVASFDGRPVHATAGIVGSGARLPACPKDNGQNTNAWYLFTCGRQLADDLASVLKYLEKVIGLGVEDITIKAFP